MHGHGLKTKPCDWSRTVNFCSLDGRHRCGQPDAGDKTRERGVFWRVSPRTDTYGSRTRLGAAACTRPRRGVPERNHLRARPAVRWRDSARVRPARSWGGRELSLSSGDRDAGSDKRLSVGSSRIPILSLLPVGTRHVSAVRPPVPRPSVRPATDCYSCWAEEETSSTWAKN